MNETIKPAAAGWPAGFRVNPRVDALPRDLIEAYRTVPSCHAGDVMGRHTGSRGLVPYHRDLSAVMCGPAVTVRIRPGDNLMIHLAMMMAEPGDVIVIDGGGDLSTAVIGGLMRTTALARGIGGFVLDGALRDLAEWAEGGIAAYAMGNTLRGPTKDGPGEVNVPVSCAGMSVSPGDLMLGDGDGVICIPAAQVAALLPLCLAHREKEKAIAASNATGRLDRERFDALLRNKGCPV
ncbi:Regulator of RNase E activity RraA [Aureimonas altamirensis DSM 21988]|uniref:Putative 4-hydroxy-4-methyl-2-oxoglutarate aldolase n=2 Tax=Aureimonas altamirensis TaxID=370622 RepID=A0A0P0YXF9_9HYPH|nr:RraA family protein [Aureimonas altamirensis]BAT26234.1 dimethylmenaquinone methyltransferase [Aureimonas altamirensis]SHJ41628.1 Regulator of RNase E activity RraA [Aureimonas altamirensis DSM 21988]